MSKVTIEIENSQIRVIVQASGAEGDSVSLKSPQTSDVKAASAENAIDGGAAPLFGDTASLGPASATHSAKPSPAAAISAGPAPEGI